MEIQESSFAVANVKIAWWFGRESGDDFAVFSSLENTSVPGVLLLKVKSWREDLSFDEIDGVIFLDVYILNEFNIKENILHLVFLLLIVLCYPTT